MKRYHAWRLQISSCWLSSPNPANQLANRLSFNRPGIPVRIGYGDISSLVDILFLHAKVMNTAFDLELGQEHVESVDGISVAVGKSLCQLLHGLGDIRCIVRDGMWQDSRVCLCMRQVKASSQRVAQFVVDGHAHVPQTDTTQPGSIQRLGPGRLRGRVVHDLRKSSSQGSSAFNGHQVDDRVGVAGI